MTIMKSRLTWKTLLASSAILSATWVMSAPATAVEILTEHKHKAPSSSISTSTVTLQSVAEQMLETEPTQAAELPQIPQTMELAQSADI